MRRRGPSRGVRVHGDLPPKRQRTFSRREHGMQGWLDQPHPASPKCAFVLSRARDGFSGSAPSWVRLLSTLRGRFQATKGPDVAWGTCVLSRGRKELNCYFLSLRGTSGLTPAQDTTLKELHNGGNTRRNRAQDELNRHVA